MSSKEDLISSAAKGATKGALEWTEEKVKSTAKSLVQKFRHRKLAFIKDYETIDLAKEMRKKSEWHIFTQLVEDNNHRMVYQMGLTLRGLERKNDMIAIQNLKIKIRKKYKQSGLYFAHFVQNALFTKYVGNLLDREADEDTIADEIMGFIENIENNVSYVERDDDVIRKTREIVSKIDAHSPQTFVISSCTNPKAMELCKKILINVMEKVSDKYTDELIKSISKNRRIYFINKIGDSLVPSIC